MTYWKKEHKKWLLLNDNVPLASVEKISGTWWGIVPPRSVPHVSSDSLSACMKLTEKFIEERESLRKGKNR